MQFLKATLVLFLGLTILSCNQDEEEIIQIPPRPYAEQAPIDDAKLQDFFNKYDMDFDSDYNVTFKEITSTAPGTKIKDEYTIQTKIVNVGGTNHNVYYIPFNAGGGEKPTNVDSVYVCYRGRKLDNTTFENRERVPTWFGSNGARVTLRSLILGWREIFPLFGSAVLPNTDNGDGTFTYNNYGAGVMFLPSALAYYNVTAGSIPAYSPLIFNFKLISTKHVDDDYDGIDSRFEDINGNGNFDDDDTDGDGRPNYLDQDDDGDSRLTKDEIRINGILPSRDNYNLIQDCSGLTVGVKKHLNKNC